MLLHIDELLSIPKLRILISAMISGFILPSSFAILDAGLLGRRRSFQEAVGRVLAGSRACWRISPTCSDSRDVLAGTCLIKLSQA